MQGRSVYGKGKGPPRVTKKRLKGTEVCVVAGGGGRAGEAGRGREGGRAGGQRQLRNAAMSHILTVGSLCCLCKMDNVKIDCGLDLSIRMSIVGTRIFFHAVVVSLM